MIKEKMIEINQDKLNLYFKNRNIFSRDDGDKTFLYLKNYEENKVFKKIEIDFGKTLFEITDLLEVLISNSYLFRYKQTQIVLNLGKLNLESRIEYLRCLSKLGISNYEINYFKK